MSRLGQGSLCMYLLASTTAFMALADVDWGSFGDPVTGQALFAEKGCVRCHAVRGAGGRVGPDLGRKASRGSFYEIAAVMWNHFPGMDDKRAEYRVPAPSFEDDQLSDLIAFLYFLNYFDEPGDPRAGRTLFTEKHCVRCHRVGEEGGALGPALDTIPRGTSPLRLAQSLWNHGPEMLSAIEASGLEVPTFAADEILDLFAYIRIHGERRSARRFESPGDPERGRGVFDAKGCAACHPVFGDEEGPAPDLGRAELRGSATQIAGRMWNHWPAMAQSMERAGMTVPVFEEYELVDLFAYLYHARYKGTPGDPGAGREVFDGKGCGVCHGPDGAGGVAPALREPLAGKDEEAIVQAMWNHAAGMNAMLEGQDLSWPRFTAQELKDLLAFLGGSWSEPVRPSGDGQ